MLGAPKKKDGRCPGLRLPILFGRPQLFDSLRSPQSPRQTSRVERLQAKVEPLFTQVTVDFAGVHSGLLLLGGLPREGLCPQNPAGVGPPGPMNPSRGSNRPRLGQRSHARVLEGSPKDNLT